MDTETIIVPTGFANLDGILGGGLSPGALTLVAGRPGMGKTSFMAQMAAYRDRSAVYVKGKVNAAVVDYAAQAAAGFGGMLLLDDNALSDMTGEALRALAQAHSIAVVAVVGISRYPCEKRADKRPRLSDLGPDLVAAADVVLALYRSYYYHCIGACDDPSAEVLVLKNAYGATGTISMVFDPAVHLWSESPRKT